MVILRQSGSYITAIYPLELPLKQLFSSVFSPLFAFRIFLTYPAKVDNVASKIMQHLSKIALVARIFPSCVLGRAKRQSRAGGVRVV